MFSKPLIVRCVAAQTMSLGLLIASPDAAERFNGGRAPVDTEEQRVPINGGTEHRSVSKASAAVVLEGHHSFKRCHSAGGQREASGKSKLCGEQSGAFEREGNGPLNGRHRSLNGQTSEQNWKSLRRVEPHFTKTPIC